MKKRKNSEVHEAPVEYLSWTQVLARAPEKFRKDLREQLLQEIKKFSEKGEGHEDTSAGIALYGELKDANLWEFVGFGPSLHYIKETAPSKDELEALWIHPWGAPALIFKHKRLPLFIMTHAGMRFNKSYLEEMRENSGRVPALRGATG